MAAYGPDVSVKCGPGITDHLLSWLCGYITTWWAF